MTTEQKVNAKVNEIKHALATREVSPEEFQQMRADLYAISSDREPLEPHNEAECIFCQMDKTAPTIAEMENAVLHHVGSGKKKEFVRGIQV